MRSITYNLYTVCAVNRIYIYIFFAQWKITCGRLLPVKKQIMTDAGCECLLTCSDLYHSYIKHVQ